MVPNWLTCLCHCIFIFIFFIYSLCPYWMFLDTEMKPVLCRKALHGLAEVKYWITHNKLQIFWHLSSPMGFRQSAEFDPYAILMLAHTSFIILHWAGYEQQHFNRDISSIRCVVVLYLTQMHTDSINNCNCQITWTWSDQMRQLFKLFMWPVLNGFMHLTPVGWLNILRSDLQCNKLMLCPFFFLLCDRIVIINHWHRYR